MSDAEDPELQPSEESKWRLDDDVEDPQWEEYADDLRRQVAQPSADSPTFESPRSFEEIQFPKVDVPPRASEQVDAGREEENTANAVAPPPSAREREIPMRPESTKPELDGGSGAVFLLLGAGLLMLLVFVGGALFLVFGLSGGEVEAPEPGPISADVESPPPVPSPPPSQAETLPAVKEAVKASPLPSVAGMSAIELGIAYGTEKRRWLKSAVDQFAQTEAGGKIRVNLLPMGSLEGAHAILERDQRIHVWCPASSMYREAFLNEWQIQHNGDPIASEELLALTPMVFVMWNERYQAFTGKYSTLDFKTIADALNIPGGWQGIADQANWGLFKFGHTHPLESNSGLQALVLMAYDFHQIDRDLTPASIVSPEFQKWLGTLEKGVSGLSNSTGNMMKEMVLKGPSAFDVVLVYESVAIDFLKNAEGRWGRLQVVYPQRNMWNDNPFYVLKNDWVTDDHQRAAGIFLQFLMSAEIQKLALNHGFRPGNPEVPVRFEESPFLQYEKYGLQIDLPAVCESPSPEVINNLQQTWQRAR
jgi:ABC-type Fe3+ transport system substrate-binding protein